MFFEKEKARELIFSLERVCSLAQKIREEAWELLKLEAKKENRTDAELKIYKKLLSIYELSKEIV